MRKNSIRKTTLHSSMRPNVISTTTGRKRAVLFALGAITLAAAAIGFCIGYAQLRGIYEEQCVITDREKQVTIHTSGQNIKTGLILELFGLTNGNNLATIDFKSRRDDILTAYPAIRDLTIRRLPPDRVEISVEERDPVARMSHRGNPAITRVVDSEGMVFSRSANRSTLPIIIEKADEITPPGQRLTGRRLAALRLIEYCQVSEFSSIGLLDVDVTSLDYLKATLGNYDPAVIAWEGMDEQLPGSQTAMERQMRNLLKSIRTRIADSSTSLTATHPTWNVTRPGYCFADIKEPIQ